VKSFTSVDELNIHDSSKDILQLPTTRASVPEQAASKEALLRDEEKLFVMFPFIDGFSLKDKIWRK
jgi:hypothetical protein